MYCYGNTLINFCCCCYIKREELHNLLDRQNVSERNHTQNIKKPVGYDRITREFF